MTATRERAPSELGTVLSPLAQRLEARARCAGAPPASLDRARARLWLAAWELDAPARAALALEPELALRAPDGRRAAPPERAQEALWTLEGPAEALARLARREPAFAVLDLAHRLACRAPEAPELMGIVNVTPDSFSDGGAFLAPEAALERARALTAGGAAWIDVGGESTRPGATPVDEAEELRRVLPALALLSEARLAPLSIDTRRASVARAALERGARMVNDVSAGTADPAMAELVAERGAQVVLMHLPGDPRTMQERARYDDVVREVTRWLRARAAAFCAAGVAPERVVLDPGLGFGKRLEHNLALLRALSELRSLGFPLCAGPSRKAFLSALGGAPWQAEKVPETAAAVTACVLFGARLVRVHDVCALAPAARVAAALAGAPSPDPAPAP